MIDFRQTFVHYHRLLQQGVPLAEVQALVLALPQFPPDLERRWTRLTSSTPFNNPWNSEKYASISVDLNGGSGGPLSQHRQHSLQAVAPPLPASDGKGGTLYYRIVEFGKKDDGPRPYRFLEARAPEILRLISEIETFLGEKPSEDMWRKMQGRSLTDVLDRFKAQIEKKSDTEVQRQEEMLIFILKALKLSTERGERFDTFYYWVAASRFQYDFLAKESLQLRGIFEGWSVVADAIVKKGLEDLQALVEKRIKADEEVSDSMKPDRVKKHGISTGSVETIYSRILILISLFSRLISMEERLSKYEDQNIVDSFKKSVAAQMRALKTVCDPFSPPTSLRLEVRIEDQMGLIMPKFNRLLPPSRK